MGYRDETDPLRARVQQLEEELSSARDTIARLQGETAEAELLIDEPGWFSGVPPQLSLQRELPFEVTDAGYEAIAELLRARLGAAGQVSQVGRTLSYQIPGIQLKITRPAKGRTLVRVGADHRGTGALLGLSTVGAVFIGLAPLVAILKGLGFTPVSLVVALPLLLAASFSGLRALLRRQVYKSRAKLAGVLESVAEIAAQHAQRPRARVAAAAEAARRDAEGAPSGEEAELRGREVEEAQHAEAEADDEALDDEAAAAGDARATGRGRA